MPNGPKVVVAASSVTVGTAAFGGILLTRCFSNYRNRGSDCVMRRGI